MRYRCVTNGNLTITVNDLLDQMGFIVTATTGYRLFQAVRLKKVEIWGSLYDQSTPVSNVMRFQWIAGANGSPSAVISDAALGASGVSHILARPPKGSNAWNWHSVSTSTVSVFNMLVGIGAIVELTFDYVVFDNVGGETPAALTQTLAGNTVGVIGSPGMGTGVAATNVTAGLTPYPFYNALT